MVKVLLLAKMGPCVRLRPTFGVMSPAKRNLAHLFREKGHLGLNVLGPVLWLQV